MHPSLRLHMKRTLTSIHPVRVCAPACCSALLFAIHALDNFGNPLKMLLLPACLSFFTHQNGVGLQSKMAIIKEYGTIAHSIAPVKDPTGEYRNAEILASKEVGLPTQQALAFITGLTLNLYTTRLPSSPASSSPPFPAVPFVATLIARLLHSPKSLTHSLTDTPSTLALLFAKGGWREAILRALRGLEQASG
jgi:hypothetical protein